jgi:plastocyanin
MESPRTLLAVVALIATFAFGATPTSGATVRAHVELSESKSSGSKSHPLLAVIWLSPRAAPSDPSPRLPSPGHFRMEQKNKGFRPDLLVVPLGSSVEFPNLDPFFHNVFSQFNGKRFDLGLYEAGSTRTVRFDHEGVSYIFCNIHSKMAAVIVTLATSYFAVARETGPIELRDVPPGDYTLHVWAEGEDATQPSGVARTIHVGEDDADAGTIRVNRANFGSTHKNKYGEDYSPEHAAPYQ